MQNNLKYLIGVDGGGTGTRVVISDLQGEILSSANGEPSALSLGVDRAWRSIIATIVQAFHHSQFPIPMLSECGIGLGLSGVNNLNWKSEFILKNPGFKTIEVDTDGYTTLLGAHSGKPGTIVALGTGSIGMTLKKDGTRKFVSGWGYPTGDEASGSWLGIKALRLAEKVLDGRKTPTLLTERILEKCGKTEEELLSFLAEANQNTFATLTPIIFECADKDSDAWDLLIEAGLEVEQMLNSLDPKRELPFSLCGKLGEALLPFTPKDIQKINQVPQSNSVHGALTLIKNKL